MKSSHKNGFTLIELLVVISIIALLSSVVLSSVAKARVRARDSARIQNARQIAIALEQYEATFNTYKVAGAGLSSNNGSGYVAKSGGSYSTNSILSTLKSSGLYTNANLTDPVYGTDNYYLGLCTSTNAYNVFVKLEQSQYNNSTTSISNTCGGTEAAAAGFNFIASTAGGSSGGGGGTTGFGGAYEYGMSASGGYIAAAGVVDPGFSPGSGPNSEVKAVAVQPDGKILIGGYFSTYNGVARSRIARVNVDGSLDTSFDPGAGADNVVLDIVVQPDGKILIAGLFVRYDGTLRVSVARINSNGSLDTTFVPPAPAGVNGVWSASLQSDGKIVLGGGYNGLSKGGLIRLNSNGSVDATFNALEGVASGYTIFDTSLQSDNKVIIGGNFITYNGVSRNLIARINQDGTLDATFNPGSGASGAIVATGIQPDNKILVGGQFASFNGNTVGNIARLNNDGTYDSSFTQGVGLNFSLTSLFVDTNGKILIGGWFTSINGISKTRLAIMNPDGSLDNTFNNGSGPNNGINRAIFQSDGKVIVVGSFTSFNGTALNYFFRGI